MLVESSPFRGFHRKLEIPILEMKPRKHNRKQQIQNQNSNLSAIQLNNKTSTCKGIQGFGSDNKPVEIIISEEAAAAINQLMQNEQPFLFDPILMYHVIPYDDEKVDGRMRDDAVANILGLHKAFLDLSPEVFCQCVSIIDNFIMKVKVKPKYMACVATAAYYLAAQMHAKPEDRPSFAELVTLTQCGGKAEDLHRMTMIIRCKLSELRQTNAWDYLKLFHEIADHEHCTSPDLQQKVISHLFVALSSLQVIHYSPACIALAILHLVEEQNRVFENVINKLSSACKLPLERIIECATCIRNLYDRFYQPGFPGCWDRLIWIISNRTKGIMGRTSRRNNRFRLASIMETDSVDNASDDEHDYSFNISSSFSSYSDEDVA